jgi:hypothetical protein
MLPYSTTYYSTIYRNFKLIEAAPDAQYAIIRYFEANVTKIQYLETDEYFELLVAYNEALFDVGAHQLHTKIAGEVLAESIHQNIKHFGGLDIYAHTLFYKAQSHLKLYETEVAIHIFRALIKMYPHEITYQRSLRNAFLLQQPNYLLHAKATFIVLNLCVAAIISIKLFIITPFYPQYEQNTDILRNIFIAMAILVLSAAKSIQFINANQKLTLFCKK